MKFDSDLTVTSTILPWQIVCNEFPFTNVEDIDKECNSTVSVTDLPKTGVLRQTYQLQFKRRYGTFYDPILHFVSNEIIYT